MLFSLISKIPKIFMAISLIITAFLLCFLLVGCTSSAGTYSDVYLTKLGFNSSSPFYTNVKAAYKSENASTTLAEMSIRVGYLSTCVIIDDEITCTSYGNLDKLSSYSGVSLIPTASNSTTTELDLVHIADDFSKICFPRLLMASLVLVLVLLVTSCYCSVPLLPGKSFVRKINCLLSLANVLLWGIGSMLQHEAVTTAIRLIPPSSMDIISASKGTRAEAMAWTAFTFMAIIAIGSIFIFFREMKKVNENINQKF